jgi:hypothetical protein
MDRTSDPCLVTSVLDDLVQLGIIVKWGRRVVLSAGRADVRQVADVYDITLGEPATAEDETSLRYFLERHGWAAVGHIVEVRLERIGLKSDAPPHGRQRSRP